MTVYTWVRVHEVCIREAVPNNESPVPERLEARGDHSCRRHPFSQVISGAQPLSKEKHSDGLKTVFTGLLGDHKNPQGADKHFLSTSPREHSEEQGRAPELINSSTQQTAVSVRHCQAQPMNTQPPGDGVREWCSNLHFCSHTILVQLTRERFFFSFYKWKYLFKNSWIKFYSQLLFFSNFSLITKDIHSPSFFFFLSKSALNSLRYCSMVRKSILCNSRRWRV